MNYRLPTHQDPGLLPSELRRLVESRREVKRLLAQATASSSGIAANPAQLAQWQIRQAALKLTANSVYGCLGFTASRFCAKGLAALVTGLGRAVLMHTKDLVEHMNLEVIYGDTDSIMVNTNSTDLISALAIGEKVRQQVNKHYRLLELDTDGVYAAILLLAKKKYAALSVVNPVQYAANMKRLAAEEQQKLVSERPPCKQELKGLDIVRRDWSTLAVNVGKRCVAALLSGMPRDAILEQIHTDLTETAEKLRNGKIPLSDFIVTKMLTKAPEEYADSKSLPHVQVALRLNNAGQPDEAVAFAKTGSRRVRAGDTVEYIICNDGSGQVATQRGYSPGELISRGVQLGTDGNSNAPAEGLSVDVHYYLAHQIHPVVSRLVAQIEGTSPARIADCLGLDPSGYRRSEVTQGDNAEWGEDEAMLGSGPGGSGGFYSGTSWNDVTPFTLECPKNCGGPPIQLRAPPYGVTAKTWKCPNCSHNLLTSMESVRAVSNRLAWQARESIMFFEQGWMQCDDPACGMLTRCITAPPPSSGGYVSSDQPGSDSDTGNLWARGAKLVCPVCAGQAVLRPCYTENELYRQLCFYRYIVSPTTSEGLSTAHLSSPIVGLLGQMRAHFDRLLSHSAFAMVDLKNLFVGLRVNSKPSKQSSSLDAG